MRWSDVTATPSPALLRQFAGLCLLLFGGMAIWRLSNQLTDGVTVTLTAAVGLGALGLVKPQAIRPLYSAWLIAVFPVSWTVSLIVLAAVYYGVLTPTALVAKLAGRDVLALVRPPRDTCWSERPQFGPLHEYLRQF